MATQVERAIAKGKSLLGSHDYDNYCQRFVRVCYKAAGITGSASSAWEASNKWLVSTSKSNIPTGAAVYFHNSLYGHVGIYLGDNQMIHAWGSKGVIISSIDICSNYYGWGWQGGTEPTGAGTGDYTAAGTSGASSSSRSSSSVELCSTSIVSSVSSGSGIKKREYVSVNCEGLGYELHIINNGIDYVPIATDNVQWTTELIDSAGKLTFTVLNDGNIDFTEGNTVIFKADNVGVFYGYIFEKSKGRDNEISCIAYDQLRYFKNKDTYCYKNKKYSEVVKMIADEYNLLCSDDMCDTEFVIEQRIEDDVSLFDMVKNAREATVGGVNKLFVLFDDFGRLNIKNVDDMITDVLITEKGAEDFKYKTSIDGDVYNRIQLYKDDDETGNRAKYIYEDSETVNSWGILQQTARLEEGEEPQVKGGTLLNTYNKKLIELSLKGCFGNTQLRAGAGVFVSVNVGNVVYDKALFVITKAVHSFGKSYTCDLEITERNEL